MYFYRNNGYEKDLLESLVVGFELCNLSKYSYRIFILGSLHPGTSFLEPLIIDVIMKFSLPVSMHFL